MEKLKQTFRRRTRLFFHMDEDYTRYYEPEYRHWWSWEMVWREFCALSQSGFLNSMFSLMVLCMLILAVTEIEFKDPSLLSVVDLVYNAWYALVVASVAAAARRNPEERITCSMKVGFLMDVVSYFHYLPLPHWFHATVICYLIRVHRPLRIIWTTDSNNMNSSLLVTALKYMYYSALLRVLCACFWIFTNYLEEGTHGTFSIPTHRMLTAATTLAMVPDLHANSLNQSRQLINALYLVNKIFIPIGPSVNPTTDFDRVLFLLVMMLGVLLVTGAAVATLSSVISLHMRPEESFRTRYRIIMRDLTSSGIPNSLINKVETFYKMYWHKQRAVCATQLLPSFPPVLPKSVYTDIYFEATQKSGLLRDLSYRFLSEVAKHMETILYIPGDSVIRRNSQKNSIIYITYGDIEMLTAEDDISPMLRFTRGTILAPWGSMCGRAHVAIRAATFCAAHALPAPALWRAARTSPGLAARMLEELRDHMNKVKRHYAMRGHRPAKYKSSILEFKKKLMALKEARDANGELLLSRPDYFLEIAGCYLMRNRADATLRDDSDAICLRQTFPCILQPTSSLLTAWNWLVAGLIVVVCFTYPYYLIYKKTIPLEFRFFDLMVTVIYVLDMIVYLSTGANVEEGVPITFLQTASLQIKSPWFVLDILGTFPIFRFVDEGQFSGLNKILRFPKVIRVIKSLEEEVVYHSNVVRFMSYALILFIACYFIAALQQVFVCYGYGYCLVTNFTHQPFWTKGPLDDATVTDRLYFSLYWAISVLTFTSHVELGEPLEKDYTVHMYTALLLEMCIVMHICIEAVYSATIMVTTSFRVNYDSCISDVRNFLIRHKVAPQLRQRFIEHLLLCWNTRKAYSMASQQSTVFYDLPPHVYHDILARQRCKYILCIPFMKLLHKEDLENISSNARLFYVAPNEILLNTGDISTEMYVIKQGFCEVLNPDTGEVVGTLVAKNHFGVLECIFRFPAFYTVRASTHVQVFSISRKNLVRAFDIPQIKDAINFAKEQEEYSMLQVRREPFVSYEPPASAPNRVRFRLPRKHEKDSAFLQPFKKLGFLSIMRHMFPRFTFRPDSELLTRYEICRAFCAFACAFVFPSYTYLVLQFPWLYQAALVLDLFAYSDVVFRMLVGYFDANGILVYHPANTAAHYLRGAFFMDTFSCLPLESLEVSRKFSYGKLYQVTAMKQVLMMNRLLQLYRLPGTLEVLTSRIERRDIILVLQALPLFLTVLNALTSLLVFSSVRIYHSVDELEWAFVPTNDKGGSWIHLFHNAYRFNVTATPWELHLGCYFWIVYEATTTGYNTLAPTNLHIMAVLFSAMVFGSLIMIYMSVRIISIRANVNNTLAAYQEHMKDLVQYMQREKLDKQLQKEMTDHYEFNWVQTGGVDARNVLKQCDQTALRSDAILNLYGPAFAKCPILAGRDAYSLLRVLGRAVHSIHFLAGTTIFQQDDIVDQLYIVYSGELHLRTTDWDRKVSTIQNLAIGSMVGNLDDTSGWRASCPLVAATDVHLLQMSSSAFHHVVRYCDYHVIYQLMARYRADHEPFIDAAFTESWPSKTRRSYGVVETLRSNRSIVQVYLILISILCVYLDLYNAGFQDNRVPLIAVLYALDACFLMKILIFFTLPGLLTLPGEDEKGIKTKYFKSAEFKYDVASCLPIELGCLLSDEPWLLLSLSWLRLNRMMRIKTVSKYLKRYQKRATENLVLSTLALIIWFTLYVHICACLWFFIGLSEHRAHARGSWYYDDNGNPLCNSEYICSVYFVLTTFSQNGVNDVMPRKQIEVLYVSLLCIVSTMVYVVYVGEFSNIVQYASFRSFSYYSKVLELQNFLKNNRVSPVLVALVHKYTVLLWREARGEQLPEFLVTAPLCLKLDVMSQAYINEDRQHPVFQNLEPALLRQIVGHLRQYYYDENMYVVQQSEVTNSMYLVHTGEVEEISEFEDENLRTDDENRVLYHPGQYFGVAEGLVRDKPFRYSYRTTIKSQVLTLRLDDWEYLLKHFPDSKRVINIYQWTRKDDDNDQTPEADGSKKATTKKDLDILQMIESENRLIGVPPDAGPGRPPDVEPGKPPGIAPGKALDVEPDKHPDVGQGKPPGVELGEPPDEEVKRDFLAELKRTLQQIYSKLTQSQPDNADETTLRDINENTSSVERKAEGTNIDHDVTSKSSDLLSQARHETSFIRRKSVAWAPKMTKLSETSFETQETLLSEAVRISSSEALFKRIRNAAMAVELAMKQTDEDNDNESQSSLRTEDSDVDVVSVPHTSVEEYLAYKYKMQESYSLDGYNSKGEDQIKSDNFAFRRKSRRETRLKYIHEFIDRPAREDFRNTQLAETSLYGPEQNSKLSSLNLDRSFGDVSSLPALDSEIPVSSNQLNDTYETKNSTEALPRITLVDFDSDVAALMTALPTPTELSSIPSPSDTSENKRLSNTERSSNIELISIKAPPQERTNKQNDLGLKKLGENSKPKFNQETEQISNSNISDIILVDFDSDVAAQMATSAGAIGPAPPVELPSLVPTQPEAEPSGTEQSAPTALLALSAPLAPSDQRTSTEIDPEPIDSTRFLKRTDIQHFQQSVLMSPVQITDLTALPPTTHLERVDSQVPTSTKQATQQVKETLVSRPIEIQSADEVAVTSLPTSTELALLPSYPDALDKIPSQEQANKLNWTTKELDENSKSRSDKEKQQISNAPGENGIKVVDFDSELTAQMAGTPAPPVELPSLVPAQLLLPPSSTAQSESSATLKPEPTKLLALPAPPASSQQRTSETVNPESIVSALFLEPSGTVQYIMPPEDKVKDLAALPATTQLERVDSQVPTSSKAMQQVKDTPRLRPEDSLGTAKVSDENKSSPDTSDQGKDKSDQNTDRGKDSDEKK